MEIRLLAIVSITFTASLNSIILRVQEFCNFSFYKILPLLPTLSLLTQSIQIRILVNPVISSILTPRSCRAINVEIACCFCRIAILSIASCQLTHIVIAYPIYPDQNLSQPGYLFHRDSTEL